MPNEMNDTWSDWRDFGVTLLSRISKPSAHPRFVLYFFGIIVLGGSLGISIPSIRNIIVSGSGEAEWFSVLHSASTYTLAILAAALADAILSENVKPSLKLLIFVLAAVVGLCAIIILFLKSIESGTVLSVISGVLALFLWWVSNAENANLLEPPPKANVALGGDVETTQPN